MVQSKLFVLKQEIELLWTEMNYERVIKPSGKPDSQILGGEITVCFATTANSDLVLRWMTKLSEDETSRELDKMEEGKVCFYADGFDYPATRTYEFNDSFPVFFQEVFDANGEEPFQTVMTISPAIQNYGAELIKSWNVSYIPPGEETPFQAQDTEDLTEEVVDCYITDLEGNEKGDVSFGEDIYLVVKTRNMIGQTKNIDLSNLNKKFEYNNEILEDNTIKNFSIKSDLQKVKLKVVKSQEEMVALEN